MALILSLETSTSVCSAALARDGKLLAERVSYEGKSHATLLTVFVEQILNETRLDGILFDMRRCTALSFLIFPVAAPYHGAVWII